MDKTERDNWAKIAESMEAIGEIASAFHTRARAIADGKPDPIDISALPTDVGAAD